MTYAIMNTCHKSLSNVQQHEIQLNSVILGTDSSPNIFLNGIVAHKLPNDNQRATAYQQGKSCKLMIDMIKDPSLITHSNITKVHNTFRSGLRTLSITYENHQMTLQEPTIVTDKSIKLIILPNNLQKHIFNSFHTNLLGGHFSLYQTLHRIRLRFIWPHMFKYIKENIQSCAACILKNNAVHPSSEVLFSFPLDTPMNTIHADL